MLFKKEVLQDLASGLKVAGFEIISRNFLDQGRWKTAWSQIFEYENKFYKTVFYVGSTEMQDTSPYEYEEEEIECEEVFPVEKTIVVYEPAKKTEGK